MRFLTLALIVRHFDEIYKDIDFEHLPERESEEYRLFLLKLANEKTFREGRLTLENGWTLELFDEPEAWLLVHDVKQIDALTDSQRQHLSLYMDLVDMCYPLFKGRKVDWTAWPWNLQSQSDSMDNNELFYFITEGGYSNLSAAILYDLKQLIWMSEGFYSSPAQQEVSNGFHYGLEPKWEKSNKTEDDLKALNAAIDEYATNLWFIENHMLVGQMLGFDFTMQSVYDAMSTFIDRTYRHDEVKFALEFGRWINENMTMGEKYPSQEKLKAFEEKFEQLKTKYNVHSPSEDLSYNYITLDLLGMSMFPEESTEGNGDEDDIDNEMWSD